MSAIGPGDWAECVRGAGILVPIGSVHRIEAVRSTAEWTCRDWDGSPLHRVGECFGVRLSGGPNPSRGRFWNGCCFRPIYSPKSDFRELLTTPADQRERVDA